MTQELKSLSPEERAVVAREAVKAFRRMMPSLTAFVRALANDNELRVEAVAESPCTDGKTVRLVPELALGLPQIHDRELCDRRGADEQQMCSACANRERQLAVIYHEVGHIVGGSTAPTSQVVQRDLFKRIMREYKVKSGSERAKQLDQRVKNAPIEFKQSFMGCANIVSQYLPILLNALEDARINKLIGKARPGYVTMMRAMTTQIFEHGFQTANSDHTPWGEQPLNAQIMIGLFLRASGYQYRGWLDERVCDDLEDSVIADLLFALNSARTIESVYDLGFPVLDRLRELGYCRLPDDPDEPEQEESGESGAGEPGEPQEKSDPSEDSQESEDPQENEQEESDDQGGSGSGSSSESAETESDDSSSESDPGEGASDDDSTDEDEGDAAEATDSSGDSTDSGSGRPGEESASEAGSDESDDVADEDYEPTETGTGDISGDPVEGDSADGTDGSGDQPEDDSDSNESSDRDESGIRILEWGTPEEVKAALGKFGDHEPHEKDKDADIPLAAKPIAEDATAALRQAIDQGQYFETPSDTITGVKIYKYDEAIADPNPHQYSGWARAGTSELSEYEREYYGITIPDKIDETILGPALLKCRRTFDDNRRAHTDRNRKSGRIRSSSLAKRAPFDDPRMFGKRTVPGKKDYFVLLGLDISGSTAGGRLGLMKTCVLAQAELLHRTGVPFAIYAHSGVWVFDSMVDGEQLDIYEIKTADEPWDTNRRNRLANLASSSQNLDGHTLEFYRKICDQSRATDRIIMYYSDGKMPASNYQEELEILQREIKYCKQRKITLMAVGIETDAPMQHGLDTVQVDSIEEIGKVVTHLEKRLESK